MLRGFIRSGQSVRAFCRERDLSEPSFYAWRRTLARRDAALSTDRTDAVGPAGGNDPALASVTDAPALLPVRLVPNAYGRVETSGRIEILLVSGTRLRLRPPVDLQSLAAVLAALDDHRPAASASTSGPGPRPAFSFSSRSAK